MLIRIMGIARLANRLFLIIILIFLALVILYDYNKQVILEDLTLRKYFDSAGRASEEAKVGLKILILSSVGRSGSSFLAELISQLPNTFYVFEPMHYYEKNTDVVVTPEIAWTHIKNISDCHFEEHWLGASARRGLIRSETEHLCEGLAAGDALSCATGFCLNRTNLVMKTIRMRVTWLPPLLLHFGAALKVIHLVRDPRATFRSARVYAPPQRDCRAYCPLILEDLLLIDSVKALFPGLVTSVKYEDLCLDAEGVATELWRFISGDERAPLPPSWARYLENHTQAKRGRGSPYKTWRDTPKEAEQWRSEIDEALLLDVERHCRQVIDLLGHNAFRSLSNARNRSVPLRRTPKALYTYV